MSQKDWLGFSKTALAAAVALAIAGPALAQSTAPAAASKEEEVPRAADDKVRLGTITVVGEGGKLGTGMMLKDDSVKGRSTVTKAAMEKELGTGNVLQSIAELPGVNTFNYDATGLFGGDMTMRGFGSDQIGFTVNGVPVNDSGGYAFYAQEMIDKENVCTASVAQGSPELESPHSGATGGSVSMITCDPTDKRRVRASQTLGGLNLARTFVRVDTGRFLDNKAKAFISYSHAEADKWKGEGKARKDHIDAGFSLDLSPDNRILGSVLYNRMVNQNIYNISLAQLNQYGYYYDYRSTYPTQPTPGSGAQTAVQFPTDGTFNGSNAVRPINYGLALNPFKNVIASLSWSLKLADETYLKVQPYLWYGFGNGGWSQTILTEGSMPIGGAVDINGDGDTRDTVAVGRASVTKTNRPGVTAELSTQLSNHYLKLGLWYERANHQQTQPAVKINADGVPSDIWLQEGCIQRANGSCYQGRDTKTISTAYQLYLNDQISLFDDRAFLSLGLRTPSVTRDVTNYANESGNYIYTVNSTTGALSRGTQTYQDYEIKRTFKTLLPQIGARFNLDSKQHVFLNGAKNFRAPPNFAYYGSYVGFINGVATPLVDVKPETSVMIDGGYRFQSKDFSVSATVFNADFKNRQVQSFDPNTLTTTYINAGGTKTRGLELEAGTGSFMGFSAYGSLTLQKSKIKDNLQVTSAGGFLPIAGKQFGKTPEKMMALSLQYERGPMYVRLKGKYTGSQYADLMNQEKVPGYTTANLDAGYSFGKVVGMSNVKLALNISNLTNKQYRSASSILTNAANTTLLVTGTNYTPGSSEFYYLGAPRLTAFTLSADFE